MQRIAIVDGVRTPFIKARTDFEDIPAQELGRIAVRELLERTAFDPARIDEVIFGCVAQPPQAANIARVISLLAGIPKEKPGYTVSRNCASGIEAVTSAYEKISAGVDEIIIAGGTESMSNIPLFYGKETAKIFLKISKAKTPLERLAFFLSFRPRHFLNPEIGLQLALTDPVYGLNMGETAEALVKECGVMRLEQDRFAMMSHKRALSAREKLREEIVPVLVPPKYERAVLDDNGVRERISLEDLIKLKPYFDCRTGSITAGNSCQISDGACALLIMREEKVKEFGLAPLGFIRAYAYVGLGPAEMGVGPAFAIHKVLAKSGLKLSDMELIEINEAFAGQVIACQMQLQQSDVGSLNMDLVNVNGGSIALGHPLGATGSRLVLAILKEMKRRNLHLGLVSLCVGGGQGAAVILERS